MTEGLIVHIQKLPLCVYLASTPGPTRGAACFKIQSGFLLE